MVLTKHEIASRLHGDKPLLSGLVDAAIQIQPNGVDFSVSKVFRYLRRGILGFDNRDRSLPELQELELDAQGAWDLAPGPYLVQFREFMNLPDDMMAIGRPRSSLLRMGATVDTAVWDAGFSGLSQSLLLVQAAEGILLKERARILQVVFCKLSASTEMYDGQFKTQ